MKRYCIGARIMVNHIDIGIFEDSGTVIQLWTIDSLKGKGCKETLYDLAEAIQQKLKRLKIPRHLVRGIGVSVPGEVGGDGIVNYSMKLGWGIVNVRIILQEMSGFPVVTGSNRDMAVLGEHWVAGSEAPLNMAGFNLEETLQGSMIIHNRLIFNKCGISGDLGKIPIFKQMELKCLKTLEGQGKSYSENSMNSIYRAIQNENPLAEKLLADMVDAMVSAIEHIECIVKLDQVLISGPSDKGNVVLIQAMYKKLSPSKRKELDIRCFQLGKNAEVYGSAKHLLNTVV